MFRLRRLAAPENHKKGAVVSICTAAEKFTASRAQSGPFIQTAVYAPRISVYIFSSSFSMLSVGLRPLTRENSITRRMSFANVQRIRPRRVRPTWAGHNAR